MYNFQKRIVATTTAPIIVTITATASTSDVI
jgi:hypothetical protein